MSAPREAFPLVRSSGVLLHPTSLPDGRLGPEAYHFVDWLVEAGQPSGRSCRSAHRTDSARHTHPARPSPRRRRLLAGPWKRPSATASSPSSAAGTTYLTDDWTRFVGGDGDAVAAQVRFDREWSELRAYANAAGIRLIGDLPLYAEIGTAPTSLSSPRFFDMSLAAGVPPDLFSRTGQLWGNPPDRWSELRGRRLSLVDRAFPSHVRARGRHAHRSLPRPSFVLGGRSRRAHRRERPLAPRARQGALRRGRARARTAADDRRGSRAHHAARSPAAQGARRARHARARVPASTATVPTPSPTISSTAPSTPGRTTTIPSPRGGARLPRKPGGEPKKQGA